MLRNEHDLSNPCSSRTDDFLFFISSISNVVVLASMLSRGVDGDAVSSFSIFLLKFSSLLSSPRKITFSSDLLFCRMVVTDERLQVRRLLIFFQNFPKDVFKKKCFSLGKKW